ncbi:Hypothetical protein, putative, partial [Bodo saltans]
MRRLRSIALSECDGVTDGSLKHIGELLHSLRSLDLHECRNVTNIGLDSIRGLLDLERLQFTTFSYSYTVEDDDGLRLGGNVSQAETTRHWMLNDECWSCHHCVVPWSSQSKKKITSAANTDLSLPPNSALTIELQITVSVVSAVLHSALRRAFPMPVHGTDGVVISYR